MKLEYQQTRMMNFQSEHFLNELLAPLSREEFFGSYWHQKELHISRNDPGYFADTLSLEQIDEWLERSPLHFPDVSVVGAQVDDFMHPEGGRNYRGRVISKRKLNQLFQNGQSFKVNSFSRMVPSLRARVAELRESFSAQIGEYLVMSGANASAFPLHNDPEHVIAIQIGGRKRWNFHQRFSQYCRDVRVIQPFITPKKSGVLMQPGDSLYIPPGLQHQTESVDDEPSLSLSISIDLFQMDRLVAKALQHAAASFPVLNEDCPHPLATVVERESFGQRLKKTMQNSLELIDLDELIDLVREDLSEPSLCIRGAAAKPLTTDTRVIRSTRSKAVITADSKVIRFRYRNEHLTFHGHYADSLKYVSSQDSSFLVSEIAGALTPKLKTEFAQHLRNTGYLEVCEEG
ncbi:MAG: cupin domain-containing protein [Verrucomicrobiota bacterium]